MNLKKIITSDYKILSQRHHYQLTVILLFTFGFLLIIPYYLLIQMLNLNKYAYQWYFFVPWMFFYIIYCLVQRSKIKVYERRPARKRPIGHWVILGLVIIYIHLQPSSLEDLYSLDLGFLIFTLFLADSYWDFRKIVVFGRKLG